MKKTAWKAVCWLLLWGMQLPVWGQESEAADLGKWNEILQEVERVSAGIETLECNFLQRRTVAVLTGTSVSEGKMYYRKADRMRWEYLRPEAYYFVMNNGKSVMKKDGETDRGGGARIFGEISKLILACISGQKLVDESKFQPEYTIRGDVFRISLRPRNRRMQQMMSRLDMEFSLTEYAIRAVEMRQGEDVTRIEFKDKKINEGIAADLFDL